MQEKFLKKAIALAKKASGNTSPNPLVGAVIVKNDKVIASGYHKKAGQPHAEINAIEKAGKAAKGTSLYINLEPCCHHGKTPPCVDAVIKAGIKEVFIGMSDPNPLVAGKGARKLKSAGIKVTSGILKEECEKLNESFIKFITKKMPFIILKSAATLDGKTATKSGDSKWITNEKSREYVHRLRSEVDAIMVGSGTLENDDPLLTARIRGKRTKNPVRVIMDTSLRINPRANVLKDTDAARTIIFTSGEADKDKIMKIKNTGADVLTIGLDEGLIDLKKALKRLAKEDITSVLVEGGSKLHSSFLRKGLADKMYLFLAPKLLLGCDARPVFSGASKDLIKNAIDVNLKSVKRFDDDIMLEFYF